MDLAEYMRRRGLDLAAIVAQARKELRLAHRDVLFLCGSVVEGLGNDRSDLDFYLVTSRNDIAFTSLHDVMLFVGECVLDVRVVARGDFEQLLARFNVWASSPRDYRGTAAFSADERLLLHRLRTGEALYGADELETLRERVTPLDLMRYRFAAARYAGSTIQVDLAGLRAAGDRCSMTFAAQELLGHTADALLAVHGFTNVNRKWRARGLADLPADWEATMPGRRSGRPASEIYWSLHRAPEDAGDAAAVLAHAHRITAFSRRVFAWAEHRLFSAEPLALHGWSDGGRRGSCVLPHLDLDVAVSWSDGRFEVRRLNAPGLTLVLSPEEYSLLCLFDGESPPRRGCEQIAAMVHAGDLEARPMIDEEALRRILRPQRRTMRKAR